MEQVKFFFLLVAQLCFSETNGQLHGKMNLFRPIRDRIMGIRPPVGRAQILNKKEICYDMIGCFDVPRKHSIKKPPQSPQEVDTKFWLYTRASTLNSLPKEPQDILSLRSQSQLIGYGDSLESLNSSYFDPTRPLKVLIHGFKGSGKEKGALFGVQEFLLLEDVNVLVVDWEKGAADSYPTAAANTELIGRQTAIMLLDMISLGSEPGDMHIIGFSLGAHIAGCAGDMLKLKGYKLGRITGLDPASPLFRHQFLRESSTKLDKEDADFVDVIHTDGSPVFTDGFGLLSPIGHVDFFPNGGREQPGCHDGRGSVVVSHLEGTINSSVACSHVRAWFLFLESVRNLRQPEGCQFIGYPCSGGNNQFARGQCFLEPIHKCLPGDSRCNIMGMGAHKSGARGALYLVTRDVAPYCGEQLQTKVDISDETKKSRGYLHMRLLHGQQSTNFKLNHELADLIKGGTTMSALAVAQRGTISARTTPNISAIVSFQSLEFQNTRPDEIVFLDHVTIKDGQGHTWYHCGQRNQMKYLGDTHFSLANITFTLSPCKNKEM